MNILRIRHLVSPLISLTLVSSAWPQDAVFQWPSDESKGSLASHVSPPKVETGEFGSAQSLFFHVTDPSQNPGEATFLEAALEPGAISELTISLFIKPEESQGNEDLVTSKSDTAPNGFRLRKSWNRWGLDLGDGSHSEITFLNNPSANLDIHSWQHIAVTFKEGKIAFYKNGALIEENESPITQIALTPENKTLRVGAGLGTPPSVWNGFHGSIAAFSIFLRALTPAEMESLYEKENPERQTFANPK